MYTELNYLYFLQFPVSTHVAFTKGKIYGGQNGLTIIWYYILKLISV